MARRKIIWTINAKHSLRDILAFYNIRNGNSTYKTEILLIWDTRQNPDLIHKRLLIT